MIKSDVISQIAKKTGFEKRDVKEVIEMYFDVVKDSLVSGDNVYFRGFGSFILKKRARKIGRNITKNTWLQFSISDFSNYCSILELFC